MMVGSLVGFGLLYVTLIAAPDLLALVCTSKSRIVSGLPRDRPRLTIPLVPPIHLKRVTAVPAPSNSRGRSGKFRGAVKSMSPGGRVIRLSPFARATLIA